MAGVQPRVDVATCARAFVSRVAHEIEASSRRAEVLRTRAAEVARWLRERGATDVWLYGSLAWGEPHGQSDVDLLVEGLPSSTWPEAVRETERLLAGARVDVSRAEETAPSLVERVHAHGIRLP